MFRRTFACLRRAHVVIPQLSPTHTRAKIVKWCLDPSSPSISVQSYDTLFVLQCSPDLVTEAYREAIDHEPLMIVEIHDEGILTVKSGIEMNTWYECGEPIGEIFDGDDDPAYDGDWLWQAYSHVEGTER
jgi:hypothetical protein